MPDLSSDDLAAIQARFHELIRCETMHLSAGSSLKMPSLDASLLGVENKAWLPVPGMYGGIAYWLENRATELTLVCESWSRVVEGSGKRHDIKSHSTELVDEGFV